MTLIIRVVVVPVIKLTAAGRLHDVPERTKSTFPAIKVLLFEPSLSKYAAAVVPTAFINADLSDTKKRSPKPRAPRKGNAARFLPETLERRVFFFGAGDLPP